MSDLEHRLKRDLEPVLELDDPRTRISAYHDMQRDLLPCFELLMWFITEETFVHDPETAEIHWLEHGRVNHEA